MVMDNRDFVPFISFDSNMALKMNKYKWSIQIGFNSVIVDIYK